MVVGGPLTRPPHQVALTYAVDRSTNPWICVPIYLLRTGLMNATYPLEESIMMDFVPSSTRARWKSIGAISQFGWCGSAALGGILIDSRGYTSTFRITAAVQGLATVIWLPLVYLVPKSEGPAALPAAPSESVAVGLQSPLPGCGGGTDREPKRGGGGGLKEPLLAEVAGADV